MIRVKMVALPLLCVSLGGCSTFRFELGTSDEIARAQVVAVPARLRAPAFADDEDLSLLCKGGKIVAFTTFGNIPRQVWCKSTDVKEEVETPEDK